MSQAWYRCIAPWCKYKYKYFSWVWILKSLSLSVNPLSWVQLHASVLQCEYEFTSPTCRTQTLLERNLARNLRLKKFCFSQVISSNMFLLPPFLPSKVSLIIVRTVLHFLKVIFLQLELSSQFLLILCVCALTSVALAGTRAAGRRPALARLS